MSEKSCPQCGEELKKCLIQQNYSLIICPNEGCSYPFNEREAIDNIVYTKDAEILNAAKRRLEEEEQQKR
ncbi:hypothetical protein ACU8KH_00776 [Lachancea thermotolerans]